MAHKLLIVDDEADTLRLVSLMLERQGYEVFTAKDGKTALESVASNKPDLILLDVMMPDMDGYEVVKVLRSNPKTEDIAIIMFTAKSQVEDKITGLEAGADVYLTKLNTSTDTIRPRSYCRRIGRQGWDGGFFHGNQSGDFNTPPNKGQCNRC
jgi:DNA-binding response OmpR family regulator